MKYNNFEHNYILGYMYNVFIILQWFYGIAVQEKYTVKENILGKIYINKYILYISYTCI